MPYDIIVGRGEGDKKKFGNRGLIHLGRGYVKMGNYNSLSNNIYLDVARSHVVLVAGKRGSGKSYTLGVMTEEISNLPKDISENLKRQGGFIPGIRISQTMMSFSVIGDFKEVHVVFVFIRMML